MFYSNNDSYMQDLYFYNQIPNNTYMNNPVNNMSGTSMNPNFTNAMMSNNMNPNQGFVNQNAMYMGPMGNSGMMPVQNLSSLYPSIYRIITPVVSRVVSNGNNQIVNEDFLNNMVDTVFNIVEGQIDIDSDSTTQRNSQTESQTNVNSSNNTTSNINSTNRTSEASRTTTQTSNTRNNRNDSLLRDLIKILIIKELLSRNQFQRQYVQSSSTPMGFNSFF